MVRLTDFLDMTIAFSVNVEQQNNYCYNNWPATLAAQG